MSDRELLELAAKAAGVKLHVWGTPGQENFADMDAKPYGKLWNPLTDDGDALRLAVKLNIVVAPYVSYALADSQHEDANGDIHAATRRAIVRAAASLASSEITKTKE